MRTKKENPDNLNNELEELSIEEIFGRLDGIMEQLEDGTVSLEDSFAYYENGMRLVQACSAKIDKVEKRILVLNGQVMEE